jgi:hypothetical protein
MATRVFFLTRLKPGVDPAEYEQFVREQDYPVARGLPSIERYEITRLEGLALGEGEPPAGYLEVLDVTDLDSYRADVAAAELAPLWEGLLERIEIESAPYGTII